MQHGHFTNFTLLELTELPQLTALPSLPTSFQGLLTKSVAVLSAIPCESPSVGPQYCTEVHAQLVTSLRSSKMSDGTPRRCMGQSRTRVYKLFPHHARPKRSQAYSPAQEYPVYGLSKRSTCTPAASRKAAPAGDVPSEAQARLPCSRETFSFRPERSNASPQQHRTSSVLDNLDVSRLHGLCQARELQHLSM